MAEKRFAGKTVIVTGAASGIGRATAMRFAEEGASLILGDIDAAGLQDVTGRLRAEHGGQAKAVPFDAADPGSCRGLVEAAVAEGGRLDVLCNIAGIYDRARFTEVDDATWRRLFAVNLDSVFYLTRASLPHLVRSKGNVVNISSIAALSGLAYAAAYAAAKAAIIALTKSLAAEYAEHGVRVNVICPGGVDTAIGRGVKPIQDPNPLLLQRLAPKLGNPAAKGRPEDIAAAFTYLASKEARYVSGSVFVVDGAQLAG
jgi:NAD(P)-dependent dehydrogenase (short-subunit alcohol dehydrogenase family)